MLLGAAAVLLYLVAAVVACGIVFRPPAPPMPAQPIMCLTRIYTQRQQTAGRIQYLPPPAGTTAAEACRQVTESVKPAPTFCLESVHAP